MINTVGLAILPIVASSDDVAQFRAAMLIYGAALVLPVAVNNDVLRPHLYSQVQTDGDRRPNRPPLAGQMLRLNLATSVLTGTILVVSVRYGATVIFGSGYDEVKYLIVPLALALPFAFGSSYVANVLVAFGSLRWVVVVQGTVLAAAVLLNSALIALLGNTGAAVAVCVVDALTLASFLSLWVALGRNGVT
jgi:O-antigen/teichoic acid export membrane protein